MAVRLTEQPASFLSTFLVACKSLHLAGIRLALDDTPDMAAEELVFGLLAVQFSFRQNQALGDKFLKDAYKHIVQAPCLEDAKKRKIFAETLAWSLEAFDHESLVFFASNVFGVKAVSTADSMIRDFRKSQQHHAYTVTRELKRLGVSSSKWADFQVSTTLQELCQTPGKLTAALLKATISPSKLFSACQTGNLKVIQEYAKTQDLRRAVPNTRAALAGAAPLEILARSLKPPQLAYNSAPPQVDAIRWILEESQQDCRAAVPLLFEIALRSVNQPLTAYLVNYLAERPDVMQAVFQTREVRCAVFIRALTADTYRCAFRREFDQEADCRFREYLFETLEPAAMRQRLFAVCVGVATHLAAGKTLHLLDSSDLEEEAMEYLVLLGLGETLPASMSEIQKQQLLRTLTEPFAVPGLTLLKQKNVPRACWSQSLPALAAATKAGLCSTELLEKLLLSKASVSVRSRV